MREKGKKGKEKRKREEKLIDLTSLVQTFGPTRKIYREVGKVTSPLRITGIRPTLRGYTFRKARLSKTLEVPTLKFIGETIGKLVGKKEKKKRK